MPIEKRGGRQLMNQINVVPYIDVMLVLLVIFMVTAPLINPGQIELPQIGKASSPPVAPLEVSIHTDRTLWLHDRSQHGAERKVTRDELIQAIRQKQAAQSRAGGGDRRRQGRALRGGAGGDGHAAAEPGEEGRVACQTPGPVTYNDITQNERTLSGTLALVMHLLFFALLVFGVSWQKKQSRFRGHGRPVEQPAAAAENRDATAAGGGQAATRAAEAGAQGGNETGAQARNQAGGEARYRVEGKAGEGAQAEGTGKARREEARAGKGAARRAQGKAGEGGRSEASCPRAGRGAQENRAAAGGAGRAGRGTGQADRRIHGAASATRSGASSCCRRIFRATPEVAVRRGAVAGRRGAQRQAEEEQRGRGLRQRGGARDSQGAAAAAAARPVDVQGFQGTESQIPTSKE